jgi:hypothetical protein
LVLGIRKIALLVVDNAAARRHAVSRNNHLGRRHRTLMPRSRLAVTAVCRRRAMYEPPRLLYHIIIEKKSALISASVETDARDQSDRRSQRIKPQGA